MERSAHRGSDSGRMVNGTASASMETFPHAHHRRWTPILDAGDTDRYEAILRGILDGLQPFERQQCQSADVEVLTSWCRGVPGLSTVDFCAGLYFQDRTLVRRAEFLLNCAVEAAADIPPVHGLFQGLLGLAATADNLCRLSAGEVYEPNQDVDGLLATTLTTAVRELPFDLVRGLVGAGVYALSRPQSAVIRECLTLVASELHRRAEQRPEGIAWQTPMSEMTTYERAKFGSPVVNCGVAHGVPGVVALLGQLAGRGIATHLTAPLFRSGANWLLAQLRQDDDGTLSFPNVVPRHLMRGARMGWCYGEPAVSAALLMAAQCAGDHDVAARAHHVALRSALRVPRQSDNIESGLCHGAGGISLIFNRLYQLTGDEEFRAAALHWLDVMLMTRRAGAGIEGFRSRHFSSGDWISDPTLLTGAAGVALVILSALDTNAPCWDYPLMVAPAPIDHVAEAVECQI